MKRTAFSECPRLFEVEALRDGRLGGAERADFERHLVSCSACAREQREIEQLSETLRESFGSANDELHARREKTRILAAFDQGLLARRKGSALRRGLLAAAVSLVALSAWLVSGSLRVPEAAPSSATVTAAEHARWSRHTEARRDLIFLEHGTLEIRVTQSPGSVPLLVVLPDGELEDIGTTFSVTVEAGRTTRVAVDEGSVLLRLHGRAPLPIAAQTRWIAPSPAPSAASPSAPSAPVSAAKPAALPKAFASVPVPSASLAPPPVTHEAADEFRAAMATLNAGRNAEAAARFARFVARHPGDPRAQDAAYMRIVALQATGDTARMRTAAQDYLRAHPNGFRRAEVERLAR